MKIKQFRFQLIQIHRSKVSRQSNSPNSRATVFQHLRTQPISAITSPNQTIQKQPLIWRQSNDSEIDFSIRSTHRRPWDLLNYQRQRSEISEALCNRSHILKSLSVWDPFWAPGGSLPPMPGPALDPPCSCTTGIKKSPQIQTVKISQPVLKRTSTKSYNSSNYSPEKRWERGKMPTQRIPSMLWFLERKGH